MLHEMYAWLMPWLRNKNKNKQTKKNRGKGGTSSKTPRRQKSTRCLEQAGKEERPETSRFFAMMIPVHETEPPPAVRVSLRGRGSAGPLQSPLCSAWCCSRAPEGVVAAGGRRQQAASVAWQPSPPAEAPRPREVGRDCSAAAAD